MAERSEILSELRLMRGEIQKLEDRVRAVELELARERPSEAAIQRVGGQAVQRTLGRAVVLAGAAGGAGVAIAKLLGLIGL